MAECNVCGAFVSADFARVFGNNERDVHGCPECTTATAILNGEATHPTESAPTE